MKRIVAINLGSTSTKIAYFEDAACMERCSIPHPADEVKRFPTIWDQEDYRKAAIQGFLDEHGIEVGKLDAFTSRGGHTEPLVGGVWRINRKMLDESASERYGNHISDLGIRLAYECSKQGPIPLTVDTPCTDEFEPLARYSGLPEIERASRFHALNQKAVARRYARDIDRPYEELDLIVVHLGGGISVAPHHHGRMIDGDNGLDGDGAFSTNRTGALPVGALVDMCYSGEYTHEEMRRKLNGMGGMMAYLGENDVRAAEARAEAGDAKADEILDAMMYQVAKEVGAAATVLKGSVDAILVTGGIAYSRRMTDALTERVGFIAPVHLYPGELEMESLGEQSYLALVGQEEIKEL